MLLGVRADAVRPEAAAGADLKNQNQLQMLESNISKWYPVSSMVSSMCLSSMSALCSRCF